MSTLETLQREFRDLKFGMFIHYGMETYHDAQWLEGYVDPASFDPGGPVDTDAWAEAAASAGMRYAVLTAKHVSGFCLWDSALTNYGVMHPDCPYEQDLFAQFVDSFTRHGLKVGAYYCWRNPGFDDGDKAGLYKLLGPECDPATHSPEAQIAFQKAQIAELVAKFPDVFYIWNDGLDPRIMPAADAHRFIRGLGPEIIASANWWDWGKKGEAYLDVAVSETKHLKAEHIEACSAAETCWCVEDSWFSSGEATKTAEELLGHWDTANANGANFLLNVGPDRAGRLAASSVEVLAEMGRLRADA